MKLTDTQRAAICRVLLDVAKDRRGYVSIREAHHFETLKEKSHLTDDDFTKAREMTVLGCLAILKEVHFKEKMMLGLTVCDIYSEASTVQFNHRVAFEILMNAIDWPISFTEMSRCR